MRSMSLYLDTTEGRALFTQHRYEDEEGLSVVDMEARARQQLMQELQHIKNAEEMIKKDKPFVKIQGARDQDRKQRETYRTEVEGYRIPDALEAVPKFLGHPSIRQMLQRLVVCAADEIVVSKKDMANISQEMAKMLHIQFGHRVQWVRLLTRGHFFAAREKGYGVYPYQAVEGSGLDSRKPEVRERSYMADDGTPFYVRNP